MIDKIKDVVKWILAPLFFLGGIVYYLVSKNNALKEQLRQSHAEKELSDVLNQRVEAQKESDNAEKAYRDSKRLYDEQSHGAGGDTSP
jgi:hypothetical protein